MKICAIICELNPLHNGHELIMEEAKRLSGCDKLVLIMSGQFTQRGEICAENKFIRAKNAILCGADAVIELPTPFAVAPAEIFACGAVNAFKNINADVTFAFGCENGDRESFFKAAEILNDESGLFKKILHEKLDTGESYIKSRAAAYTACGGDERIISSPNGILGVEYVRAILRSGKNYDVVTIRRVEGETDGVKYMPAHKIRKMGAEAKEFMPRCSYLDFCTRKDNEERFKTMCADALFFADKEELKRIYGCGEGLENKLKTLIFDGCGYDEIIEKASGKRYPRARIRRILTCNLLKIYEDEARELLKKDLPVFPLAVDVRSADCLMPIFDEANKKSDGKAREISARAYDIWRYLSPPYSFMNNDERTLFI